MFQKGGSEHGADAAGKRASRPGSEQRSGKIISLLSLLSEVRWTHRTDHFVFQTVKAIEEFGAVIEQLLVKHGKKIIGNSGFWSIKIISH